MIERLVPQGLLRKFSKGWELYLGEGECSGAWFEYVFSTAPSSNSAVGRWLDRRLLACPRWSGLRALAAQAMSFAERFASHRWELRLPTSILDLSPGSAPYLRLALSSRLRSRGVSASCLRRDPHLLVFARNLAAAAGVDSLSFEAGDPLDPPSYLGHDADLLLCLDAAALCTTDEERQRLIALWWAQLRPNGACLVGFVPPNPFVAKGDHPKLSPHREAERWNRALQAQGFSAVRAHDAGSHAILLEAWRFPAFRS